MAKIRIVGDSSGYVEIAAPNAAGNNTLELPSGNTRLVGSDSAGNVSVSGILTVSAGSISIPSISPTGDSNTGIFFPSADTIAFGEGGVEAARFDSNGRLGIGTITPISTVDVWGSQASTSVQGTTGTLRLHYQGGSAPGNYGSSLTFSQRYASIDPAQISLGQIAGVKIADNGVFGGGLAFFTSNGTANNLVERLRIDNGGNVSIGTATNNVFDGVAASRPFVVHSYSNSTTLSNSTNSITICNSDTTTSNSSQINFAAITGASANQYSSAIISAVHGARTNGQYPAGQLVFLTSSATNYAPTEKLRIDSTGYISTPNNLGAGLDIGYKKFVTITGSFSANTWYNTGIDRTTDTGIYLLNAWVDTYNSGGQSYQMTYTGLFAMPNRASNSGDTSAITLHRAGHAPNAETIQFRTLLTPSVSGAVIYLQWLSNSNLSLDGSSGKNIQVAIHRLTSAFNN